MSWLQNIYNKWFECYLSSKEFFVSDNDIFSEAGTLNCGVPQGFIMGPLLFLIYIKNLPQSLSESGSCLYVDNKCIFYQDKDIAKLKMFYLKSSQYVVSFSVITSFQFWVR